LLSPDLNGDNSLQDSGQIIKVDLIDVHVYIGGLFNFNPTGKISSKEK